MKTVSQVAMHRTDQHTLFVDASICWSVEPSLRGLFTKPISNAIGARVNRNV